MFIIDVFKNLFKSKPNKVKKRFISDYEFNEMRKIREDKMNLILEKISSKGYDSLSKHEKDFINNFKNL